MPLRGATRNFAERGRRCPVKEEGRLELPWSGDNFIIRLLSFGSYAHTKRDMVPSNGYIVRALVPQGRWGVGQVVLSAVLAVPSARASSPSGLPSGQAQAGVRVLTTRFGPIHATQCSSAINSKSGRASRRRPTSPTQPRTEEGEGEVVEAQGKDKARPGRGRRKEHRGGRAQGEDLWKGEGGMSLKLHNLLTAAQPKGSRRGTGRSTPRRYAACRDQEAYRHSLPHHPHEPPGGTTRVVYWISRLSPCRSSIH